MSRLQFIRMATIKRFEDIKAWQRARDLSKAVYQTSSSGGFAGDFGLKDQFRRAAVSVMSNIAEGFARKGDRDFARFLDISRGSSVEVQSILYVALDAGYIKKEEFEKLFKMADEVVSMISGLSSYLRRH
ncbi:MAG: four helix bundle protein [Terriglobia bacterium]